VETPALHTSVAAFGSDAHSIIARHIETTFRRVMVGHGTEFDRRFLRLVTREAHPFGNFACMAAPAGVDDTVEAMQPLLACGGPSAVFFTEAELAPAVQGALADAGFAAHSGLWAMAVDIDALAETTLPEGFTIERVSDVADREEWIDVFARGYGLPRPVGAAFAGGIDGDERPDAPVQYFWIKKRGTPVCTSLVYLADGVAGIYAVATVPEARKQGLGAHATAHPLRVAKRLGYKVGILQASEEGRPVYRRLGFEDFGELPLYIRMPG
jgi:GNAT superfamily N-acetyltransferase